MSKLQVEPWDDAKYGLLSVATMRRKLESEGYSCIEYTFSPGTNFPNHSHSVDKKDAIISGQFLFGMYGETIVLKPGDCVQVPRGVIHHAHVHGSTPVVFIDASK